MHRSVQRWPLLRRHLALASGRRGAGAPYVCFKSWKPAENFEENVRKLKQREFVDARIEVELLQLWERRDDYHHLNPSVASDRATLEELALIKIRPLVEVERFVFAWAPSETPGAIRLLHPQYLVGQQPWSRECGSQESVYLI